MLREKACVARFLARFAHCATATSERDSAEIPFRHRKCSQVAQCLWHLPVNCLHSIDLQADRATCFLLTPATEGVKQTRSLTTSNVCPVGAASGAQAKSHSKPQGEGARVSKGL